MQAEYRGGSRAGYASNDMKGPLAIISADKEIIELARELDFDVVGFFDSNPSAGALGILNLGLDSHWSIIKAQKVNLLVALALDPPAAKRRALQHYGLAALVTLVSTRAHISSSAVIGAGCVIQSEVSIMADSRLGLACKINVGATVHHDCVVGDCCTLAPGSRLLGYVHLEEDVFVGASATIMPRVRVGAGAIIGAGALVNGDVPAKVTVVGVPAKRIRRTSK